MTVLLTPAGPDLSEVVAGLRCWAAGFAADEAAVELLVAVSRDVPEVLVSLGHCPAWLGSCPRPGVWFLDGSALAEAVEGFPFRYRPVIVTAAALATEGALVDLGVALAGTPSEWLGPVFAALAHAAGCRGLRLVAADGTEPGLFAWLEDCPITRPGLPSVLHPGLLTGLGGAA